MTRWTKYENVTVGAESFVGTLSVNAANPKLTDAEFREFVTNSLPIVCGALHEVDREYKVGDAIVIDDVDAMTYGKSGTIVTLPTADQPKYEVSFNGTWHGWYSSDQMVEAIIDLTKRFEKKL